MGTMTTIQDLLMFDGSAHSVTVALMRSERRLIAAAPDLLEALEDMLSGWHYIRNHYGDMAGVGWDRAENAAVAVIAKARGEG